MVSMSPNLWSLVCFGAGSSVAEVGGVVAPVGVRGSGTLSSGMEPLGKYGDATLRNPSTSCQ